jgi:hypothetical protein
MNYVSLNVGYSTDYEQIDDHPDITNRLAFTSDDELCQAVTSEVERRNEERLAEQHRHFLGV